MERYSSGRRFLRLDKRIDLPSMSSFLLFFFLFAVEWSMELICRTRRMINNKNSKMNSEEEEEEEKLKRRLLNQTVLIKYLNHFYSHWIEKDEVWLDEKRSIFSSSLMGSMMTDRLGIEAMMKLYFSSKKQILRLQKSTFQRGRQGRKCSSSIHSR